MLRNSLALLPTSPTSFQAQLQSALTALGWGSATPAFTRATTAYQTDFEGKLNLLPSGAARMQGARVVRNLIAGSSEDWTNGSWVNGGAITVTSGVSDPVGGVTATTLTKTAGGTQIYQETVEKAMRASAWVRRRTGTGTIKWYDDGTGNPTDITALLTTSWQHLALPATGSGGLYFGFQFGTNGDAIDVWHPMWENITGQTNQNPSEYVSVGVLSTPYHGLGADGIKAFSTLNGNTVASNVVTEATGAAITDQSAKFAALPGVSGSYFSTPSAAANQITGDIDIRVIVAPTDWTSTGEQRDIVDKWSGGADVAYQLYSAVGSGNLTFRLTTDGTTTLTAASTVSPATVFSAGQVGGVRVTRVASTGKVNFYTSIDNGNTWQLLGLADRSTTAGAIYAGGSPVRIGIFYDTSSWSYLGRIYRAQIYNGINGALAVDFNPNLSTNAQTFTAATGEVWTTNGGAKIYGNTHATYGIPAQWDASGPFGYLAEGARADVLGTTTAIRRTMTDGGWTNSNMTVGTATGVDGVASAAASLTAMNTNATSLFRVAIAAASARTYSAWVSRKTGTGAVSMTIDNGLTWTAQTLTSTKALMQVSKTAAAQPLLATPTNDTFATAATGGTLAESTTYYYRVSATNGVGETLASTEASQATAAGTATNTVTVNWLAVTGATGYKVYGRSTGAEQLMATIGSGATVTWVDDGSVTPSGALPAANTTADAVVGFKIATNTDAIEADFNTLEAATFANPTPIPVNVSKAKDWLNFPTAGNVDATQGTVYLEFSAKQNGGYLFDQGTSGDRGMYINGDTTVALYDGTNNPVSNTVASVVNGVVHKVAFSYSGSSMVASLDGGIGAVAAFDGDMNQGSVFALGVYATGTTAPLFGSIRFLRIYPKALSAAKMQAMTTP